MNDRGRRSEPANVVLARVVDYLAKALPEMDPERANSVLASAKADAGKGLRQLDDYFAAKPDALSVSYSDCPIAFVRLARVLLDVGYAVSLPVCATCGRSASYLRASPEGRRCSRCSAREAKTLCARCGQMGRPAARRQEGVICYGCYAKDPEVVEPCAHCGRLRLPAMRQDDG